jgi:hypothetical protein
LADQEFIMASERVISGDFLDPVIDLRGTEATGFTARRLLAFARLGLFLDEPLDILR